MDDDNFEITPQMALQELAKRELQSRLGAEEYAQAEKKALGQESFSDKFGRNVVAGFAQLGHRAINFPHDTVKYLEDTLSGLGKPLQEALPGPNFQQQKHTPLSSYIYEQPNYNFAEMLGQQGEGTLSDKAIQGAIKYLPELLSGGAALKKASPYLIKRIAAKPYGQAANVLSEAGVSHIEPPKELLKDARQFFKNTKANRDLLKKAESGHIPSLFKVQSDLGKISAGYARNPFSFAERDFGRAGLATREALLAHKQKELENLGMKEAADLLEKGRNQYRIYNKLKHPVRGIAAAGLTQTPLPGYVKYLGKLLWGKD